METEQELDLDEIRKALYGQTVGKVVLGHVSKDIGYGSQGRVFRFTNDKFGKEGEPEFFAVKVMKYATGKMEYSMAHNIQSPRNPSMRIVTTHGFIKNKEKVCFFFTAFFCIVSLVDVSLGQDWFALVMEYCPRSLKAFVSKNAKKEPFPSNYMRNVQRLFTELCLSCFSSFFFTRSNSQAFVSCNK